MPNSNKDLLTHFQSLTDRELIDIFNGREHDYLPEAISIAKTEIENRGGYHKLKEEIANEDRQRERKEIENREASYKSKNYDEEIAINKRQKVDKESKKNKFPTFRLTFGIIFLFLGIIILVLRYELISLFMSKEDIIEDMLKGGQGINAISIAVIISSVFMILLGIVFTVYSIVKLSKR